MRTKGKEENAWKDQWEQCARKLSPDPARKRQALEQMAREARRQEPCPTGKMRMRARPFYPGALELVKVQLMSLSWETWLLQGLFLLLLPVAELLLRERAHVRGWQIFPALSVCAALGGLVLVRELSRHFSCRMAELEQSCYFNLSQLWLMRASCISGLDVLALVGLGLGRARLYGFGWFPFAVYVLTPFFLANLGLLGLFSMERGENRLGRATILLLAGAFLGVECFWGRIYETIWLPVWVLLLIGAAALYGVWLCDFGKKMEGEGLCWS